MKYTIWIIDNDKIRLEQYKDFLKEEGLLDRIIIKKFDVLTEAYNIEGSPDFILIDTTSIMGGVTLYGCFDTAVSLCRGLAEKHRSSIFCIQSAVKRWAEDVLADMTEDLKESVVAECIEADAEEFIKWIKKWINIFDQKKGGAL